VVLKTWFNKELVLFDNASENPLIPVRLDPSPIKDVAVTTPENDASVALTIPVKFNGDSSELPPTFVILESAISGHL
jgi:hypothetical protein